MLTTTTIQNRFTDLGGNTTTNNQTRALQLINDSLRYLTQKYYFNENQYQTTTVAGQQTYTLPFDVKDVINMTVNVGGVLWQPLESPNRQFFDSLNTIPFNSDFPQFSYRFRANQLNLFPIPTTTGNILTVNYKRRIIDLSAVDYTTGTVATTQWKTGTFTAVANSPTFTLTILSNTIAPANNDIYTLTATGSLPTGFVAGTSYHVVNATSTTFQLSATQSGAAITPTSAGTGTLAYYQSGTTVTGSGTSWTTNMANRWLNIPQTTSNSTSGDNGWYQIKSVSSATSLLLWNDYQGPSITGSNYTIGEVPILPEDYQDLAIYRALWIYHTSINPDAEKAKGYLELYNMGKEVLDYEFSSKSSSPVLTPPTAPIYNPNLFPRITS